MIDLYGITNCATVKKARIWLDENQITYVFHDFKKEAPSAEWISGCLKTVALENLLNKRGTTWRRLSPQQQAQAQNLEGAIDLMCANPSLIKRPVLLTNHTVHVGFSPEMYAAIFQAAQSST